MTIRDDLNNELEHLISMMPVWQRYERLCHVRMMELKGPVQLADYFEAHWRTHFMMEKIEFINKLLADNRE